MFAKKQAPARPSAVAHACQCFTRDRLPPHAPAPLLFVGFQISEAEAQAVNETAVASDEATSEGVAKEGIPGREPRPPILRARFTKARVVYLQRFTMEQVRVCEFFFCCFVRQSY